MKTKPSQKKKRASSKKRAKIAVQNLPRTQLLRLPYDPSSKAYWRQDKNVLIIDSIKNPFGELLNMPNIFPTRVNGIVFRNLEALYQSMRFPKNPALQKRITEQKSGYMAKRIIKNTDRANGRPDWMDARVDVMRWCLRVKLACNLQTFGKLLDSTGDSLIVEKSMKDDFWGAIPIDKDDDSQLIGSNVLGKLLMELRAEYRTKSHEELSVVVPLPISDFMLFGQVIGVVDCTEDNNAKPLAGVSTISTKTTQPHQGSRREQH